MGPDKSNEGEGYQLPWDIVPGHADTMFVDDKVISADRGGCGRNDISSVHFELGRLCSRRVDALRTALGDASQTFADAGSRWVHILSKLIFITFFEHKIHSSKRVLIVVDVVDKTRGHF